MAILRHTATLPQGMSNAKASIGASHAPILKMSLPNVFYAMHNNHTAKYRECTQRAPKAEEVTPQTENRRLDLKECLSTIQRRLSVSSVEFAAHVYVTSSTNYLPTIIHFILLTEPP